MSKKFIGRLRIKTLVFEIYIMPVKNISLINYPMIEKDQYLSKQFLSKFNIAHG